MSLLEREVPTPTWVDLCADKEGWTDNFLIKNQEAIEKAFFSNYCISCPHYDTENHTCYIGMDYTDHRCYNHNVWTEYKDSVEHELSFEDWFFLDSCKYCEQLNVLNSSRPIPYNCTCAVGLDFRNPKCLHHKKWENLYTTISESLKED